MKLSGILPVAAVALSIGLTGCSDGGPGSKAADTKGLVIYASHPTEMVDFFVKAFEKENGGIKVELITGGTGDLLVGSRPRRTGLRVTSCGEEVRPQVAARPSCSRLMTPQRLRKLARSSSIQRDTTRRSTHSVW